MRSVFGLALCAVAMHGNPLSGFVIPPPSELAFVDRFTQSLVDDVDPKIGREGQFRRWHGAAVIETAKDIRGHELDSNFVVQADLGGGQCLVWPPDVMLYPIWQRAAWRGGGFATTGKALHYLGRISAEIRYKVFDEREVTSGGRLIPNWLWGYADEYVRPLKVEQRALGHSDLPSDGSPLQGANRSQNDGEKGDDGPVILVRDVDSASSTQIDADEHTEETDAVFAHGAVGVVLLAVAYTLPKRK